MRLVYVVSLGLQHSTSGDSVFVSASSLVTKWVTTFYEKRGISVDLSAIPGTITPSRGHIVVQSRRALTDPPVGHWNLQWIRPDDRDGSLRWQAEVELARFGEEVEVTVAIRVDSQTKVLRPATYTLRRPAIVRYLAEKFPCAIGPDIVRSRPTVLVAGEVPSFVASTLLDPTRTLPVVLVSCSTDHGRPLVDVNSIAGELVGLAHVYVLKDIAASWALSENVGTALSCFNGAVRIYYPGFSLAANPFEHALFRSELITRIQADQRVEFGVFLLRRLATIGTLRFGAGTVFENVQKAFRDTEQMEMENLKGRLIEEGRKEESETVAKLQQDAEQWFNTAADLERRNREIVEENDKLQSELESWRKKYRGLSQVVLRSSGEKLIEGAGVSLVPDDRPGLFESVSDVVDLA